MSRDTQLKMTYGRFSVYSEPFDGTASDEVVQHIQEELNKRFAVQAQIPVGAIIDAEFIQATMSTGMHGFFKSLVTEETPNKEQNMQNNPQPQRTPLAHLLLEGVPLPSHLDFKELVAIYSVKGETFVEPFEPGDVLEADARPILICHESEVLGLMGRPADAFPFLP